MTKETPSRITPPSLHRALEQKIIELSQNRQYRVACLDTCLPARPQGYRPPLLFEHIICQHARIQPNYRCEKPGCGGKFFATLDAVCHSRPDHKVTTTLIDRIVDDFKRNLTKDQQTQQVEDWEQPYFLYNQIIAMAIIDELIKQNYLALGPELISQAERVEHQNGQNNQVPLNIHLPNASLAPKSGPITPNNQQSNQRAHSSREDRRSEPATKQRINIQDLSEDDRRQYYRSIKMQVEAENKTSTEMSRRISQDGLKSPRRSTVPRPREQLKDMTAGDSPPPPPSPRYQEANRPYRARNPGEMSPRYQPNSPRFGDEDDEVPIFNPDHGKSPKNGLTSPRVVNLGQSPFHGLQDKNQRFNQCSPTARSVSASFSQNSSRRDSANSRDQQIPNDQGGSIIPPTEPPIEQTKRAVQIDEKRLQPKGSVTVPPPAPIVTHIGQGRNNLAARSHSTSDGFNNGRHRPNAPQNGDDWYQQNWNRNPTHQYTNGGGNPMEQKQRPREPPLSRQSQQHGNIHQNDPRREVYQQNSNENLGNDRQRSEETRDRQRSEEAGDRRHHRKRSPERSSPVMRSTTVSEQCSTSKRNREEPLKPMDQPSNPANGVNRGRSPTKRMVRRPTRDYSYSRSEDSDD